MATTVAITTSVAVPILELVLVFLPDILKLFGFGNSNDKAFEQLRFETMPKLLSQLDSELPSIIDEQVELISNNVRHAFELKLEEARFAISSAAEDRAVSQELVDQKINGLISAQDSIRHAASKYIF